MTWLKKWWWAITGGILGVLGFFLGFEMKKKPVIGPGEDLEKKKAEDEATKEEQAAETKRSEDRQKAVDEHDKPLQELIDKQKKDATGLEDDLEAENAFLKKVGDDTRK